MQPRRLHSPSAIEFPEHKHPTRIRLRGELPKIATASGIANFGLVRLREECALGRRLAAHDTLAGRVMLVERDRATSRFGLFANLRLADRLPAPVQVGESAASLTFHMLLEHGVVIEPSRVRDHRSFRLRVETRLNLGEHRSHRLHDRRHRGFALGIRF